MEKQFDKTPAQKESDNKQQKQAYLQGFHSLYRRDACRQSCKLSVCEGRERVEGQERVKFSSTTTAWTMPMAGAGPARSLRERSEGGEEGVHREPTTRWWWWSGGGKGSESWRAKGENLHSAASSRLGKRGRADGFSF